MPSILINCQSSCTTLSNKKQNKQHNVTGIRILALSRAAAHIAPRIRLQTPQKSVKMDQKVVLIDHKLD